VNKQRKKKSVRALGRAGFSVCLAASTADAFYKNAELSISFHRLCWLKGIGVEGGGLIGFMRGVNY